MALEEGQIPGASVQRDDDRNAEEVLRVAQRPTLRGRELHHVVVLPLQLVLVVRDERKVTDIVEDDAVVRAAGSGGVRASSVVI